MIESLMNGWPGRRLASTWRSRVARARGFFVKDGVGQLKKAATVVRHIGQFRRIDRALHDHRLATCLLLSYRLGLFDVLSDEPMGAAEIARRSGLDEKATKNLLSILESLDVIDGEGQRFWTTSFGREFFDARSPVSLVPIFEVCETYAHAYPDLLEAARTGARPPMLDIFDETGRIDSLLKGVNYYLDQAARELFVTTDLPQVRRFIVGSMGVSFSALVMEAFPESQVTYGCLPHLVTRIPQLCEVYGVDRSRVVDMHAHGGEPSRDQWGSEAFDLVFLTKKMILDPDNDLGTKFAEKSFEVLNPGGAALFWETISDEGTAPASQAMEAFLDFGVSPRGPVLRGATFRRQLEAIGFSEVEVVPCMEGATTFVIARKSG